MVKVGMTVWCAPIFCASMGLDNRGAKSRIRKVWTKGTVSYVHPDGRYVLVEFATQRHGKVRQCFAPMEVYSSRMSFMEVVA